MNMLPIFLKLAGRRCLLVGAGNVALEKLGSLLPTGVALRVIAPDARAEIRCLADAGKLEWMPRRFVDSDLDGHFIVIAATDSPQVNAAVYRGCVERNIPCNSVDDIPNCDFFFGSVVSRGQLQIAVSTSGKSPALAQRLRHEIDEQLPADLGAWLNQLGRLRHEVIARHERGDARKFLLRELATRSICESEMCPSRLMALAPLPEPSAPDNCRAARTAEGKVFLVGAGPGDPDLLTVKALRLIQSAEIILHDDLVPEPILRLAPAGTRTINVGKRCGSKTITQDGINGLMIEHARSGLRVVRLKSGDPLIYGRAREEMDALRAAKIPFAVVPGITAAFASAAAIGYSLTDRESASNVIFSTGHHAQSHNRSPLPALEDATRVVYMPGKDLALLADEWLQLGLPPELPCILVSRAAQPDQSVQRTTLGDLRKVRPGLAPSLLLAGWALGSDASSIEASLKGVRAEV